MKYNVSADTRSLYIHWPFCPYKCHFCPFVAIANHDHLMEEYHKVLMKEIKEFSSECNRKLKLETIYMGGGTPSTYPNELLLDMFGILKDKFDCSSISEITIEANPGTVTPDQLDVWEKAGITRISIGVQSLNDTVLANLNRHQKAEDVYRLVNGAAGRFKISIDLIIGLPGVSESEWKELIDEIGSWPIQHVSMYFLMVHEGTPLHFRINKKQDITLEPEDDVVDLYYWSIKRLAYHGLEQYEVSSFARKGFEAIHNQVYWDRKPYKGVGAGACSFDGAVRFQNEKNILTYIKSMAQGEDITHFSEELSGKDIRTETLMLGLRRRKGVALNDVLKTMPDKKQVLFLNKVKELEEGQFIRNEEGRLYLMPSALAVENEVAVRLSVE